MKLSDRLLHFFHVVSNIRPSVWIGIYVAITPIFAVIYWLLPEGQFRIPDGGGTDFGSWLYYSIVTITTLGFGDYTPAHGWAQAVTACEVMCGLVFLGFFLNAVGSLKSEIDVTSALEKQKALHRAAEQQKLVKSIPAILHNINLFMAYCYAVTTPVSKRTSDSGYNPDFTINDMSDMYKPSGLAFDPSTIPAIDRLIKVAEHTSLCLDSFQNRVDLSLWPELLDDCFSFVANVQLFTDTDCLTPESAPAPHPGASANSAIQALYHFIKDNAAIATKIEKVLTSQAENQQ